MAEKDDVWYLAECLKHTSKQEGLLSQKVWYSSDDTMITVAHILVQEGYLNTPDLVIDFFEKPYKWERDMQEIIDYSKQEEEICSG